jgi:hypothetical protein
VTEIQPLFSDLADQSQTGLVSKSRFAALLGVAPSRVTQLIASGLPVENGKIDPAKGRAWYEANVSADRRKQRPEGHFSAAEELKRLRVEQARLDLERSRGALVDRQEAEDAIFSRARAERDAHLAWAARIAPVIAQRLGINPSPLFAELDRELRLHLAQLAETPFQELLNDQ